MNVSALQLPQSVEINGTLKSGYESILTREALLFLRDMERKFGERRRRLLDDRKTRQQALDAGQGLDFLPDTRHIREGDWKAAPIPRDLQDRKVEITGPVDAKMVINALNSGAKVFMADFEDSLAPTFTNVMDGQLSMWGAVRKTLEHTSPEGKKYTLNDKTAVLVVRPRGWHLEEAHILIDGKPASASFVDFALYFFHNANEALARGTGPYFYLPKLEHYKEAELWADVFRHAEDVLALKHGSIKATVLIETITAAFQMHEIIYALRDYCAGLNCGRWDYIFSFIKKFRNRPECVLPERGQVTMQVHFLKSYSQLLIQTCHKRGVFAMGGMAAQIPVKGNDALNEKAFTAVRVDKEREATNGHDGTWVAHPGLVPVAMEMFCHVLGDKPNQLDVARDDVRVAAADLLAIPEGTITEAGFRTNIRVAIHYIAAWIQGNGCVPIYHLMEDAATAEISRSQLWQWVRHDAGKLDDGRNIDLPLFRKALKEELEQVRHEVGASFNAAYDEAATMLADLVENEEFVEFLTLPAYKRLIADDK